MCSQYFAIVRSWDKWVVEVDLVSFFVNKREKEAENGCRVCELSN
jgi:hypothetical protein